MESGAGEMMFLIEAFHKENKITVLVSPNDVKVYSGSRVVFRTQVEIYYDLLKVARKNNNRQTVQSSAWLSCSISSVSAADTGHYCVVISSLSRNIESETRCFALHAIGTLLLFYSRWCWWIQPSHSVSSLFQQQQSFNRVWPVWASLQKNGVPSRVRCDKGGENAQVSLFVSPISRTRAW